MLYHRLRLQIIIQSRLPKLPANPRIPEPTKRRIRRKRIPTVDVDCPGTDAVDEFGGLVEVLGDDAGAQSVPAVVGAFDDFVGVFVFEEAHDRAEDLLFCDGHFIGDISEDCGLDEIAFITVLFSTDQ